MGSGPRLPRALVGPLAERLAASIGESKVAVCGSLRRGCSSVGDVDLVLLDPTGRDAALAALIAAGCVMVEAGSPRDHLRHGNVPVDLWTPEPGAVGACVLHATGPGPHNAVMRRWAFARGLEITWRGVRRLSDGAWIARETEDACRLAIGWPLAPPVHRERWLEWVDPYLDILNG